MIATMAAVGIQPVVFLIGQFLVGGSLTGHHLHRLNELLVGSGAAAIFAAPYVLFVGLPAFLLLRRFHALSWPSLVAVGFLLAALPVGVLGWSRGADWDVLLWPAVYFGVHGIAGAMAGYFAWTRSHPVDDSFGTARATT